MAESKSAALPLGDTPGNGDRNGMWVLQSIRSRTGGVKVRCLELGDTKVKRRETKTSMDSPIIAKSRKSQNFFIYSILY
jgi:hypothetical protein